MENGKDNTKVELYIPRGAANEDPNLFISVNGMNYLLPRGKTSRVPPQVYEEYMRSLRAQERLDQTRDRLVGK